MIWKNDHSQPLTREQQLEEDRLRDLLRETRPAEPDPAVWTQALAHIEQRLQNAAVPPANGRRWGWAAAGGATAAAVLLVFWLMHSRPSPRMGEEPFPVALASEIEILSVDGADTNTLVVGKPPVDGALELLEPGEVTLFSVEAAHDEMVPEIRFHGPNTPMIWAHLDQKD